MPAYDLDACRTEGQGRRGICKDAFRPDRQCASRSPHNHAWVSALCLLRRFFSSLPFDCEVKGHNGDYEPEAGYNGAQYDVVARLRVDSVSSRIW